MAVREPRARNGNSGFGIRDSGFGIRDSGLGARVLKGPELGFGIRDSGFGIRDSGLGARVLKGPELGFGIRDSGFGIRDWVPRASRARTLNLGFGIRDSGFGIRDSSPQSHSPGASPDHVSPFGTFGFLSFCLRTNEMLSCCMGSKPRLVRHDWHWTVTGANLKPVHSIPCFLVCPGFPRLPTVDLRGESNHSRVS